MNIFLIITIRIVIEIIKATQLGNKLTQLIEVLIHLKKILLVIVDIIIKQILIIIIRL